MVKENDDIDWISLVVVKLLLAAEANHGNVVRIPINSLPDKTYEVMYRIKDDVLELKLKRERRLH